MIEIPPDVRRDMEPGSWRTQKSIELISLLIISGALPEYFVEEKKQEIERKYQCPIRGKHSQKLKSCRCAGRQA